MNSLKLLLAFILVFTLSACGEKTDQHDDHGDHAQTEEVVKGEHGGRLLKQDGYAVELAIAEDGVPPHYKAWLYQDGEPLPPTAGSLTVQLIRLGNIEENHLLAAQADGSLEATSIVGEPHSFEVKVSAQIGESDLHWDYPSYEGRVEIARNIADESGIKVAKVGAGIIADEHEVQGLIATMEGKVAQVMARFSGPIRELKVHVGDKVKRGQTLAIIESNNSLSNYAVISPINGMVLQHNAHMGAVVGEGSVLYEVADLSQLWVDLHIFGSDAEHIQAGAKVEISRLNEQSKIVTQIDRILPSTATASQSTIARATIDNSDGAWRPGAAVKARITVAENQADLIVPLAAIQSFRDWDVVFIRIGDVYEIRPVELGVRDSVNVQVLSGIQFGDEIVVEQSYLIKADIEKSGASHDH